MESASELSVLSLEVSRITAKGKGKAWPASIKEQVISLKGRYSIKQIHKATGIPKATLFFWLRKQAVCRKKFRRIRVKDEGRELMVSSPKGFLIQGLVVEDIKNLEDIL